MQLDICHCKPGGTVYVTILTFEAMLQNTIFFNLIKAALVESNDCVNLPGGAEG